MPDIDYTAVLADLERKRDELDAAINAIRPFLGTAGSSGPDRPGPEGVRPDSFFGMNILDAAVKYLQIEKRPKRAEEIADALIAGGYMSNAKNFHANVSTTLRRDDDRGGPAVRMPNKTWALAEWYPSRPKKQGAEAKEGDSDGLSDDSAVTDAVETAVSPLEDDVSAPVGE